VSAAPRIGTAGWSIPRANAEQLPGEGSHLQRYARRLNAAEINSSFYRPHAVGTYERWAEATPADFRFAVKVPKSVTHLARLAEPEEVLDEFMAEVAGLGPKLGVLLVQLPPSLQFDAVVVEEFLVALLSRHDGPVAVEPRHASWLTAEADALLAGYRVARVAADPPRAETDALPGGWPGLVYHRLHGSPRIYYSSYEPERLAALVTALEGAAARGAEAWCIFDNTASGAAMSNALWMAEAIGATAV
jgi:uncharacterized protein YecE (DUF72 family)